ncbi:MAG: hypothetical protein JKX78_03635 [Alteromonadaceae bacterium]|nr:hypothetical protein [Alteromonadaceae bacterium]MBL4909110.1 hypothetical protein [Alteromonadaceae bacterium]
MKNPLYFFLCANESTPSTGSDTPQPNTATELLQMVMDMEQKRRKLHRELSQQEYLIVPMNGPDCVGEQEVVSFEQLLVMVGDFNKGKLPHCDDWFSIYDITQKSYPMKEFYQFIK